MTRRSIQWLCLAGLLGTLALYAADVSGKWTAQVPTRGGETRETTFMFKQAGSELTGTMSGPQGDIQIQDGKVEGDNVSFAVALSFGGNEMKFLYKGTVSANEIKFTRQREGSERTQEFTAKRAES